MELKEALQSNNFRFKETLGQNFISDKNLLSAIVSDSGIGENDTVVEIGTGGGTLTTAIAEKAQKVISFEVDKNLEPVLQMTLKGHDNIEVVMRDVLKMSDDEFRTYVDGDFSLIANLPYYITTPLITRFLFSSLTPKSLTVMVQKEVALRICAKAGESEYSAISASVQLVSDTQITRTVSRKMFYPMPKVDSAVIKITPKAKFSKEETESTLKLIKLAFIMRRKTLYNNLKGAFTPEKVSKAIEELGLNPSVRGEDLTPADFVKLAKILY